MKLLFKQRFFSWFDSYDIYNEEGDTVYTVKGAPSWGHRLIVCDALGNEIGTVREKVLSWLPKFEMFLGDRYIGRISKELTLFKPKFFEWDYSITDSGGQPVASVSKKLWNLTDTYEIDVLNPQDAVVSLMLVLAIDAEKCSRNS